MMGEKQTQQSPLAEIPSIAEIIKLLWSNAFLSSQSKAKTLYSTCSFLSQPHRQRAQHCPAPSRRITHWAQPSRALHSLIFLHATSLPSWAQVLSCHSRSLTSCYHSFSHLLSKYPRGLFCALGFVAGYLTPDYASRPSKSSGPAGNTLATGLSRQASGMVRRAGTSTHWAACPRARPSKGGHSP